MKKLLLTWVVVFIAWQAGNFIIHGLLLSGDYAQLSALMRTEAESMKYLPWEVLAHVIMAGAFAWIYSHGVTATPWLPQGLRFGVAAALLATVPQYLIYYAVQPLPGILVVKQITHEGVLVVLLGVLAAFLYRQAPAPEAASQS
ncbi:MAG: hypothetical protein EXR54_03075 [Dehalococcoidia bacterium]|nr:hypothetical protein [Dehalococcoidia bacterium]MSQ16538.1 hypothetical protein [Dehalococcoidia bacterium]